MKTLILIRHAKSGWHESGSTDFERSLNHRGLKDGPMMGRRLAARLDTGNLKLDGFFCSAARRASQTATLLANELAFPLASINWRRELYLASPATMVNVIQSAPDKAATMALLAHNPGITELAEQLTKTYFGNVPTCGVITLRLPIESWKDVGGRGELIDFDFPKRQSQ